LAALPAPITKLPNRTIRQALETAGKLALHHLAGGLRYYSLCIDAAWREMEKPIYVTQPYLPPLAEFFPYLEKIWCSPTAALSTKS
jgi:hypothetical protein